MKPDLSKLKWRMLLFYTMLPALACEIMGWWLAAIPLFIAAAAMLAAIEWHDWLEMEARWRREDEAWKKRG
jgi:hypothetical protein